MNTNKLVGSIMILIGTTIGAGILALATESAAAGFPLAALLMGGMWILTTLSGLMVLEVNLALPSRACSFSSMAEQTLGSVGKVVTWISYLLLLYSITASYIAGGTSIITAILASLHIKTQSWVNAVMFTLILGFPVYWSTKAADYFNRSLFSVKGLLLLAALGLMFPYVSSAKLAVLPTIGQAKYLGVATPIILLSFFYHCVIPSLRIYVGDEPQTLKRIIIWGAIVPLVLYLLWLIATLGTISVEGANSFTSWAQAQGSVGEFIQLLVNVLNNRWITSAMNGFSGVAMTTSFVGVALGLFDFLADGFKIPNTKFGRLRTALLTFIPPLAFAIFYPKGFTLALNYAAIFVAIIALILPSLMVYRLRRMATLTSPYRVVGGTKLFVIVFLLGIVLAVLPIMVNLELLPSIRI